MGSLNHALSGNVAPGLDKHPLPSLCEYWKGLLNVLQGNAGGAWWRPTFEGIDTWINDINPPPHTGPEPTSAEATAVLMMKAHIKYDLATALTLEGIGTDADYACIGKVVQNCATKHSIRWKITLRIGNKHMPEFDPSKLRDKMRDEIEDILENIYNVDTDNNPYKGARKKWIGKVKQHIAIHCK